VSAAGLRLRREAASLAMGALPLAFLLALFVYPVLRLLLFSVEDGSFAHFEKALTDGLYVQVFLETLRIALTVAAICLVLGYPVAYGLAIAPPLWAGIGLAFLLLPFWTSVLVRTYAWMILLGRNGVFNRALLELGVIDEPLALLHNTTGVLIGMVHVLLPYMVFPVYSVMRRVDRQLLNAAEGLGASPAQAFRRIYLPLTLPGVLAGTILVFVISLGFFITPALLGGGRVLMIGVLVERLVRQFLDWGLAAAVAVVLLTVALSIAALFRRILKGDLTWT
jgi:ABC-type spermidine/putrescine transport system permease subunit I